MLSALLVTFGIIRNEFQTYFKKHGEIDPPTQECKSDKILNQISIDRKRMLKFFNLAVGLTAYK